MLGMLALLIVAGMLLLQYFLTQLGRIGEPPIPRAITTVGSTGFDRMELVVDPHWVAVPGSPQARPVRLRYTLTNTNTLPRPLVLANDIEPVVDLVVYAPSTRNTVTQTPTARWSDTPDAPPDLSYLELAPSESYTIEWIYFPEEVGSYGVAAWQWPKVTSDGKPYSVGSSFTVGITLLH